MISNTDAAAIGGILIFVFIFFMAIGAVLIVLPYWRIFTKAGYSGALSLLMIVPLANFIMPFVLAFSEWPIEKELNMLRAQLNPQQFPPQYPPQNYPPQPPKYPQP
ncbi:MAG TPA: hypothetical protein VGK74_05210 [Symbiobacteriaceae bacterium]|jgi:hypothetical protein